MRRGEFDRLPGAGRPLPPDDLEVLPEALRAGARLLRGSGFLPRGGRAPSTPSALLRLLEACGEGGDGDARDRRACVAAVKLELWIERRTRRTLPIEYRGRVAGLLGGR